MNDDHQFQPWYLIWTQYQQLLSTKLMMDKDAARARNAVRSTLVNQYPEFFAFIEWSQSDLMHEGDPIVDDFIDKHFPNGLPENFDFYYEETRRDWEEICEARHVN